jgi:hypothetical protein
VGPQRLLGPTLTRLGPIPQLRPALGCACVAAVLIASPAVASTPMNPGLSRTVSAGAGAVIAGVTVSVRAASTGLQQQQATNAAPVYRFAATKVVSARQVAAHPIDGDARYRVVMRTTYDLPWPRSADHLTPWQKVLNS